ncbi:MAG: right-handed parallel beta-helix repeat-containing protein, partial [Phaeodactylibacter sp.]|nr:right-handed parallel beta-helix repeat-containing protein [Phaeodactylibacter sp.]
VVAAADTLAGNSYQWQFGAAGTAAGGQATYTFDSAGLYDVILTVSDTCGNSAADTLQVEVEECDTTALLCGCPAGYEILGGDGDTVRLSTLLALGILPPAALFNSCLAVAPGVTLWVDTDYDIAGGEVYMHPGSEILVRPDGPEITFAVSGMEQTTGIQGCGQMWKGIRVEDSRLVLKGARVADARYAVHARNKAKVLVDDSYFNRNFASLYFSGSGSESFSLEAFLATEVLGYQPLLPPFAGQSPAPGARPYAGIEIHNDPSLKSIGSAGGAANRFDGLRNGILTENTPLAVHNSFFTDIVEATSEPYPLSGFGIRHSGGAAHPLLQRGSGNSPSSAVSFRNCAQAIRVEGTTADIAGNYMVECKNGVRVQLAQNRNVLVHDNFMDVSTIGIELLQNAPLEAMEVEGNTITTKRWGIEVEETGIAFADATVRFNTVTLQGKGYGIRLNSVNGLEASNNGLFLGQAVQPAEGILVSNATDCVIRENTVYGAGGDNLGVTGLRVWSSNHSVFDCNTFTELGTGAEFRGSCIGSTVSTNTFDPGTTGMGRGLVYNPNLNIGVQSHAGNLWEVNSGLPNDGYGAAAVNFASDINIGIIPNSIEVDDDSPPLYPISFDFPNILPALQQTAEEAWFPVNAEGIADTCLQIGGIEPIEIKNIHLKVARSEQLDEDYPSAMLWVAQLQLYRKLEVEEWPADEVLDSFYLANDTTLLSAFYQLEKGRDSLYHLMPAETAQLQKLGEELDSLIGFILQKDSLIAAGATGLENARDSLLNEAAGLCVAMDSLEHIVLQARLSFAGTLLAENSALGDTAVYQTNEKLAGELFLNTLAQGSSAFDAQQTESLLFIAGQCPLSSGRAVHYARSLYQLVADSTFVDVCEVSSERLASGIVTIQEEGSGIRIFPNPTSGELVVEAYCSRIDVVNQLGQPVWSRNLPEGEFRHSINLQDLPGGIYFLQAWLRNERVSQELIISK